MLPCSGALGSVDEQCLREVEKVLSERAKTLTKLPKDVCPENKVTRLLAGKRTLALYPLVFSTAS